MPQENMIQKIKLENYGTIDSLSFGGFQNINLIGN